MRGVTTIAIRPARPAEFEAVAGLRWRWSPSGAIRMAPAATGELGQDVGVGVCGDRDGGVTIPCLGNTFAYLHHNGDIQATAPTSADRSSPDTRSPFSNCQSTEATPATGSTEPAEPTR